MAPVQVNLPGTIERYNNMSRQASDAAVSNIAWFRIAEMGKQPRPNRTLNNLEKMVEEQRRKHQPPTEEKQQEAEQTAAEEKKQREEELKNRRGKTLPKHLRRTTCARKPPTTKPLTNNTRTDALPLKKKKAR